MSPRLDKRPDTFLDEERVAALDQHSLERFQGGVEAQEGAQELARTFRRERVESQLTVIGLTGPAMTVLGPVVDQEEDPGRGQTLDQAVEQGLRLGIDPVQVLEDQKERLRVALAEQEALDGLQCALPALRGIER